jgi:hypothetical protein
VNRLFPNFVCYEPVTSGPTRPTSMNDRLEGTMKRRHPWAWLQDFLGNLWCALWHGESHLTRKYPGPFTSPLGQILDRFPLYVCSRCGRLWSGSEGNNKLAALTWKHCEELEMHAYCKKCGWYRFPRNRSWTIPPCWTCGEGGGQVRFCSCGSLFNHEGPCQSKP